MRTHSQHFLDFKKGEQNVKMVHVMCECVYGVLNILKKRPNFFFIGEKNWQSFCPFGHCEVSPREISRARRPGARRCPSARNCCRYQLALGLMSL